MYKHILTFKDTLALSKDQMFTHVGQHVTDIGEGKSTDFR